MNEPSSPTPPQDEAGNFISPMHPRRPDEQNPSPSATPAEAAARLNAQHEAQQAHLAGWATEPTSPSERLAVIRDKMERVANEYAKREISRAQFNAIYAHYSEQRAIIEKIIARNPQNEAWKQAARGGKTAFLREHFEGRPLNYVIYLHRQNTPLMGGGTRPDLQRIAGMLRSLWANEERRIGLARLALVAPQWLVMAAGQYSVTFVTFYLEPSGAQMNTVNDLHTDFERANRLFLKRGKVNKEQLVFPQRALLEQKDAPP